MKTQQNHSPFIPLLSGLLCTFAFVQSLEATTFTPVGPLTTVRYLHTATLLANGKVLVAGGTTNTSSTYSSFASAELYDPSTGSWSATGPMSTGRYGHTATLLPSGKVLVTGGYGTNGSLATTELYDPASGSWTLTGSLNTARNQHTATLLVNGKVLVAGGFGNASPFDLSSAEIYDPATGLWTPTGSMAARRNYHTATLLANGMVLVAGGQNGFSGILNTAEIYDPGAGSWTGTGSMNTVRDQHTATLLPNGKVLVAGGANGVAYLYSSEVYDPVGGTWAFTGTMRSAHDQHTASLLPGGFVLVTGGLTGIVTNGAEIYDPSSGLWSPTASMNWQRYNHTATVLASGRVLVAGGFGNRAYRSDSEVYTYIEGGSSFSAGSMATNRYLHTATLLSNGKVMVAGGNTGTGGAFGTFLSSAELFDPITRLWSPTASMSNVREMHSATLLPDGRVLVTGGLVGFTALTSSEVYDPVSGTWAATASMNNGRYLHAVALLPDGKVLVAGGNFSQSSAEIYDPVSGTWVVTGSMNSVRACCTGTLLPNGQVLVAGGQFGFTTYLSSAELYDPASGTWTLTGAMNSPRSFHTATLLPSGKVLVAGGVNSVGILASAEIYDPNTGTWTATAPLNNARERQTAMLLPNGKVFIVGGVYGSPISTTELFNPDTQVWETSSMYQTRAYNTLTLLADGQVLAAGGQSLSGGSTIYLSSAETFEGGPYFNGFGQPQIATFTSPLVIGQSLALTGSGFRGLSEDSGGDTGSSPSDYPVVQLRSVEGGETLFLLSAPGSNWSDTSFASAAVSGLDRGWTLATVFVNGIRGKSALINLASPNPGPIVLQTPVLAPDGTLQCSFTNTPAAVFTALTAPNPSLALSNWTVLPTSVEEVSPGHFQFSDPQAGSYPQRYYRVRSP
jgi:WD40 repeat protein